MIKWEEADGCLHGICECYKVSHDVQEKRWLEEDGMRLGDYLLVHFGSLWD